MDLDVAERAWTARPDDPAAGEAWLELLARAGRAPPLRLLERRTLAPRTLELPAEGLAAAACGWPERRLFGWREAHVTAPPPPRAPGPFALPARQWLHVRLEPAPPEQLSRTLSALLRAAAGERLTVHLTDPEERGLGPGVVAYRPDGGPAPRLESLEVRANGGYVGLAGVEVGALTLPALPPPGALPGGVWSLAVDSDPELRAPPLTALADALPGLRALSVPVSDATAPALRRLRGLERLAVMGVGAPSLSEATGAHLSELPSLQSLRVDYPRLEPGFVAALAEGPARLDALVLMGFGFIDGRDPKLYREVGRLPWLRALGVYDVDRKSVKGWERLERLEELALHTSPPSDALDAVGWRTLAGLPRLRTLTTRWTGFGDVAAQLFARCRTLEVLDLREEHHLSDVGLAYLHGHPALRSASLQDTKTTPEGRARLRAAAPGLEVYPP